MEICRLTERTYGSFSRSITLPRSVEVEKIEATMTNGVLKVTTPKDGGIAARNIEIQTSK